MATNFKQVANNAQSTAVSGAFNNTTSPLTFSVQSGHGARFPSPGNGFYLTVWNSASYPDPFSDPNMEIVLCTARTTDSLTVTRGQRGTTATAKTGSPDVRLLIDSTHISDLATAVNTLENAAPAFYSASYTDSVPTSPTTLTKTISLGVNRTGCIIFVNDTNENFGGCIFVGTSGAQYIGTQSTTIDTFYSLRTGLKMPLTSNGQTDITLTASLSGSTLTLLWSNTNSSYGRVLATQVYVMAF